MCFYQLTIVFIITGIFNKRMKKHKLVSFKLSKQKPFSFYFIDIEPLLVLKQILILIITTYIFLYEKPTIQTGGLRVKIIPKDFKFKKRNSAVAYTPGNLANSLLWLHSKRKR